MGGSSRESNRVLKCSDGREGIAHGREPKTNVGEKQKEASLILRKYCGSSRRYDY
jgi:hypothetical protein